MKRGWILAIALLACSSSKSTDQGNTVHLELISSLKLDIDEPSGLALGAGGSVLWVVGNNPELVYKLFVSGEVLDTLSYTGEDLEGIAYDPADSTLWIVEERKRQVVHLDQAGKVLSKHSLGLTGEPNSGLEGIGIDGQGNLYVLNEKKPGLLISLNRDLSIAIQHQLQFASDYSGLTYDRTRDSFWVTSHEEKHIYLWNAITGLSGSHQTSIKKMEGIAIDTEAGRLYVVSETDSTLYVFSVSGSGV